MKSVYFISGLGADKRIFSDLDLSYCKPQFVEWITPKIKEPLQQYARRLRQTIPEKNPLIIGMSFGGMLAAEMARSDLGVRSIIISSNKSSKEFPAYLRIGKYLPLYKWLPFSFLKKSHRLYSKFFGVKGKEQKKLFRQILDDADPQFITWAIWSILRWESEETSANIIHIHGTSDILLPLRFVKPDYVIKKGTHVMTMNQHEEVSALLKNLILKIINQ